MKVLVDSDNRFSMGVKIYKHTQIGWITLILLVIVILLTGYLGVIYSNWIAFSTFWVLVMCLVLFASLTVVVDNEYVRIRFGIGLLRKKFRIKEIESCEVVRNKWWYGWGIRNIPRGWLFNVSGLDAVELLMRNRRMYRIGTDEPRKLAESIRSKLEVG